MSITALWVEKYRPSNIDQYIFHDDQLQQKCKQWIEEQTIPHLLLSGQHGSGKTALALILINAMNLDVCDVLTINGSSERGIDTFRDKITNFSSSMAMGEFKVVYIDEADKLTADAQDALKRFTEEKSDYVRFILTCNHSNKLNPPLKSRFQEYTFTAISKDDAAEYLATILVKEKVKFTINTLDKHIEAGYPDIRKMVNTLQQYSIDNILTEPLSGSEAGDYILDLIPLISDDDWVSARKLLCGSITSSQYEQVYTMLYHNINKSKKFKDISKWEEAIITIAEHLYKNSFCADQEINLAALLIKLGHI